MWPGGRSTTSRGQRSGRPYGPGGEYGSGAAITQWVQQNFTAQDVGGTEIFDLTGAG